MNVADTCSEHCNAEISDSLALVGISAFAHTYNAVFFTADRAHLSLKRDTEYIASVYESCCLFDVLSDRIVRTVKHYRRETCVDASLSTFESTVVKVESYGYCDVQFFDHALYHAYNGLITAHILACALRNT